MKAPIALLLAALIAASTATAQDALAEDCTLAQVLKSRATIRESAAAFTQERRIKYVSEPLHSSGRLHYVAPAHLEMAVEMPQPESFVYEDGVLTIETAGAHPVRQISVESDAILSAMFAGLLGTLAGNEDALRDDFHVGFNAEACWWRMTLVPKLKRVLAKVREINLRGTDERIEEAEVVQANGDRSVLRISERE